MRAAFGLAAWLAAAAAHADPLTIEGFYRAIREGRGFITNGPMLFAKLEGQGDTRSLSVEAIAREPIDRIEVVANGQVIERHAPAPNTMKLRRRFSVDAWWSAARASRAA